jgi:hypothetical protein
MSRRGERGCIVSLVRDAGERCGDTFVDPARQQRPGIADLSLRQRTLNLAAIGAIQSSASVSMGKSPS